MVLEAVCDVEYLGDEFEAVSDVERSRNHSRIVAKSGAEHLPEVTLLGLRRNARRRARSLTVDDHHRRFDHRGNAQSFAHQRQPPSPPTPHPPDTPWTPPDPHV